jgi:hypothetical protein
MNRFIRLSIPLALIAAGVATGESAELAALRVDQQVINADSQLSTTTNYGCMWVQFHGIWYCIPY